MQLVKDHINILLPLLIISTISRRLIPELQFLYYPTPVLLVLFLIAGYDKVLQNKQLKYLTTILIVFGIWAMITSLWSNHLVFTLLRGGYFVLLALGITSGVALWRDTKEFKRNPFGFLLPANLIILVTSFISLISGWPESAWTGGNLHGFMGIFGLQLSLGMVLFATFLAPFYLFLKSTDNIKTKSKKEITYLLFYIVLLTSNILLLFLSYSRAALISLAIGIALTFFLYFNKRQKIYFAVGILLIVFFIISIPSLSTKLENYTLKGTSHLTANREILWGPSYDAAKIGGLFGIGYGTSATEIETQFQIVDDARILRREKGNSVLGLIEEVGLVGLVLFLIPIIYSLKLLYIQYKTSLKVSKPLFVFLNSSFIIAFLLHSQSEAWFVGTGSFTLVIFLSLLSISPFLGENRKQI